MKIEGTAKEIADFVVAIQSQPHNSGMVNSVLKEITDSISGVLEDMR